MQNRSTALEQGDVTAGAVRVEGSRFVGLDQDDPWPARPSLALVG